MKTTMKKVLSMSLALVLLLGTLPMAALATEVLAHVHSDTSDGICDGCAYEMDACDDINGGHVFDAGAYMSDANNHWQVCNKCLNWFNTEAHTGGTATCKDKAVCTVCNQSYGGLDPANHAGETEVRNAVAATCGDDGHTGNTYCKDCGAMIASGAPISATGHSWDSANCEDPKTCSVCGATDGAALGHTWKDATCTKPKTCKECGETQGAVLGHDWKDATCLKPRYCKRCDITEGEMLGHDWEDGVCLLCGEETDEFDLYKINFDPNYNTAEVKVKRDVPKGTRIYSLHTPVRYGYTFEGWYRNENCTNRVGENETVTGNATYYANWIQVVDHEVYVKFYSNGNTSSVYKYVDLYEYAQDGVITLDDLQLAAKRNINANNKAGLKVYGPFDADGWERYSLDNYYRNSSEKIYTNDNSKTVIYAMVHNVEIPGNGTSTSTSKADKTNPKTGDEIFVPVAILGMSASALAVAYYLNKKRAF